MLIIKSPYALDVISLNIGAGVLGILFYLFYLAIQVIVDKLKCKLNLLSCTNDIKLNFHIQVDDVVDGIAIQLGGGYVGLLSVPLFKDDGLLTNPSTSNAWVYPRIY